MDAAPDSASVSARLTIDLTAVVANWRAMAAFAPAAETAAVVKADGYGVGAVPAAGALFAAGCRTFFVATAAEGVAVRDVAPDAVIYVLDGVEPGGAAALAAANLRPVLNSLPVIEEWLAARRFGQLPQPAIQIDTGMNRLGLAIEEARALAADSALVAALGPTLVMSHLACGDEPDHPKNVAQRDAFAAMRALYPGVPGSLANSAGVILGADYQHDLTRPGIALYGGRAVVGRPALRPVVTAEAPVLQVRTAAAGETVGYGARQTLKRSTRLAVLGVGYADGYHRAAGSTDNIEGASVFIRGRTAPLVGRVSMDLMVADVTEIADVHRGDMAELFGPNILLDDVADRAGTIGYELLTDLGRRYRRRYIG